MGDTIIKVFGERNTGTRAAIQMIDAASGVGGAGHPGVPQRKLRGFVEQEAALDGVFKDAWKKVYREAIRDQKSAAAGPVGVWKHAAPFYHSDFKRFDVRVLFLVRNPYSWALSLHRRPYHNMGARRADFAEFLGVPWMTLGRDQVDKILPSPMDLWSLKLSAYRQFARDARRDGMPSAVMTFEDFTHDPVGALTEAAEVVSGKVVAFTPVAGSTKKDGVKASERRDYYANELWRADLTAQSVALINERVNWDIAQHFGYARLDPSDFPDGPAG